jgi:hypothetical protein
LKSGDAQTLSNDEEVRRIYLGKNFKLDQWANFQLSLDKNNPLFHSKL